MVEPLEVILFHALGRAPLPSAAPLKNFKKVVDALGEFPYLNSHNYEETRS